MKVYSYFSLAKRESLKSNHKHKIGAVLVSGGRVLSRGYNQIRHLARGKRFTNFDCSLHAERHTISKVNKNCLKGSSIFIYREYADGTPAMAAPCTDCYELLKFVGIKTVYFSINEFPFYKKWRL
jgi:deoxycytidylate deaminase